MRHGLRAKARRRGECLTPELLASLEVVQAVLATKPQRRFQLWWRADERVLAANDAAEEEPRQGSGGFHLVFLDEPQKRHSFVANVHAELYQLFQPGDHHIAQLELAMILYGLMARPSEFRGRRGVWFVDNTAALMSLIRGRSSSTDLSRLSQLIHLCLFALNCTRYWERIPSKSNWADDISRLGWEDPWPGANGFHVFPSSFPHALWTLPVLAVINVVQFL